jgi:hexosaminidase
MWMMRELSWYLWDNHGRNTIGWSEGGACQADMPPGSMGQWWLLGDDIATLAEQGYDVVNTYFGILYLDKFSCRLPHMYEYDITGGADPAYHDHILGAEAALWTEYVETESDVVDKMFPRIIAVAENVWTPDTLQDYDQFYQRLLDNLECLDYMGIDYGDMEE